MTTTVHPFSTAMDLWEESDHRSPCSDVLQRLQDFQPEILRILEPGAIDFAR